MGTLFGFIVGYVVGARAGHQGFDRLVEAMRTVRQSSEFQSFVELAKDHARGTLHTVSERLAGDSAGRTDDLIAQARARLRG